MNCFSLKLGLDEENNQLSKKEMEKREGLHIMSYWVLMRELLQDVKRWNYDARYIYHLEDRIGNWKQHVEESQIGSR